DIHCPDKAGAEALLKAALTDRLGNLPSQQQVMLKLTLPERDEFYAEWVIHPKVLKVVALSGGYSRDEANARLRRNNGIVASFSRALVEGLSVKQSAADFDATLDAAIQSIFEASCAGRDRAAGERWPACGQPDVVRVWRELKEPSHATRTDGLGNNGREHGPPADARGAPSRG